MAKYATGMIPSPPHHVGLGHPHHLAAAPPPSILVTKRIPHPVVNQLSLGSCTGNSTAVGLCVEMSRKKGLPEGKFVELPSRLFLYLHARATEGTVPEDAGAMISDVFFMARKLGFPPESAWPYPLRSASEDEQLAQCVKTPDPLAYHEAADQRVLAGAWRLQSTGKDLSDDIARAIDSGSVVVWGTDLDQAFFDLTGSDVWPGVRGPNEGGHAMLFTDIRPNRAKTEREFGSTSSWDYDFADNGTAWVSQAAATDPVHASEHWVISLIDDYSGSP